MATKEAPQSEAVRSRPRPGPKTAPPRWKPALPTIDEESETEGSESKDSLSPVANHPHVQAERGGAPARMQFGDVPGRTGWVPALPTTGPGPAPKGMLAPQRSEPNLPEPEPETANPKRLVSVEEFKELTYQNFFTRKSTAQKRIIELLTEYHRLGQAPVDAKASKKVKKAAEKALQSARNSDNIPDTKLDQAAALLGDMRAAAQAWLRKHTVEDDGMLTTRGPKPAKGSEAAKRAGTDPKSIKPGSFDEQHARGIVIDGQLVEGTAPSDPNSVLRVNPNRQKRLMGMARFQLAVEAEQRYIGVRARALDESVIQDPVVRDEVAAKALEDHYGDFNSLFSKLGVAIDKLVPRAGDSASFEVEFAVPIPDTPLAFTGKIALSASRATDKAVSAEVEIMPGIGAEAAGVASFNAAIGMYTSVSAGSGADIMTLISYGLYRKLRQSNAVPAEVSNQLWGGSSGRFGQLKADRWSRGVEKKMWGDDAEHADSTFLEWGVKGEVSAEAGLKPLGDGASIGFNASVMAGSRYDKTSLTNRKGGAGEKNMRSDGLFTKHIASRFGRGAEKDLSRRSYTLASSASMTVGILEGEIGSTYILRQQGLHKDQRKGLNNWVFEEIGFSGKLAAQIPAGGLAAGALLSRDIINGIRAKSQTLVKEGNTQTPKDVGTVVNVGDTAEMLSGLDNGSESAISFDTIAAMATGASVGIEVEFSGSVTKAGTEDREAEFTIDVRLVSGLELDVGYLGMKAQKGSRLTGAKWSTETGKWESI